MAVYMIGYDLNKEGAAYQATNKKLIERIRELFPTYWHHLDSTWLVKTEMTPVQVRDDLGRLIDADDELLVAELSGRAAWRGFNQRASDWLKKHL